MINVEVTEESQRAVRVRLQNAQRGIARGLRSGINAATIFLASRIKRDYLHGDPVKSHTGNLSRAVHTRMLDDATGVVYVGAEAPYAKFVNDGTLPHLIVARNAKALRFIVGGEVIFRRSVNHPGIRARRFMELALAASVVDIRRIIQDRVNRGFTGKSVE